MDFKYLVETKNEFNNFLSSILVPTIYDDIYKIYELSKTLHTKLENSGKNIQKLTVIDIFKMALSDKAELNAFEIEAEYNRIKINSGCIDWFDNLVKASFKSYVLYITYDPKTETSKYSDNNFFNEIAIKDFIHRCLIETCDYFKESPEVFIKKSNKYDLNSLIQICIYNAMRKMLPYNDILNEYININHDGTHKNTEKNEIKEMVMNIINSTNLNKNHQKHYYDENLLQNINKINDENLNMIKNENINDINNQNINNIKNENNTQFNGISEQFTNDNTNLLNTNNGFNTDITRSENKRNEINNILKGDNTTHNKTDNTKTDNTETNNTVTNNTETDESQTNNTQTYESQTNNTQTDETKSDYLSTENNNELNILNSPPKLTKRKTQVFEDMIDEENVNKNNIQHIPVKVEQNNTTSHVIIPNNINNNQNISNPTNIVKRNIRITKHNNTKNDRNDKINKLDNAESYFGNLVGKK
jgi:hypothetical protein